MTHDPPGARLARAYLAGKRAQDRVQGVLSAWIDGLWLGMFDRDGLAALDQAHYETLVERRRDRTFSYSDEAWNTSGLQPWEAAMVDDHFPAGARVVVTGAGG